jgi:uncharacterized membrane protein YjfL (UPF0719 family)
MWKVFENIIAMFIYAAVYIVIMLISLKIIGATFSPQFEKKISDEGNIGLAIIGAGIFIGLALLLSSIAR